MVVFCQRMDKETIGSRALASTGIVGLMSVLQFVVGFLMQMVLARLLAPEVFGQFAFVLLMQGLLASARTIQAGEFLVYRRGEVKDALSTVFTTDLVLSWLTTVIVVLFAGPIMAKAQQPGLADALRVSILVCALAPFSTPIAVFQRDIDFTATARARVGGLVVGPILKISLALAGWGIWSLVIGEVGRQAVEVAIVWRITPLRPSLSIDWTTLKEALRFSLPLSLNSLLVYYYWKVDDFVVGRQLGMEQLGYYWLAFRIPEYMMTLRNYFVPVVFATFARLEEVEDQKLAFCRLTRLSALVLFPLALVALVHGDALITVIFGARWAPATPAFQLLMLTGALRMCTSYAGDLFKVSGRTWVFPLTSVVNAGLLTAGVFVLTNLLGITGTALAVLLMIVLSLSFTEALLWKWFRLSPSRVLLRPVAALAACTLVGTGLRALAPGMGIAAVAADCVLLVGLFCVIVRFVDHELVSDVEWVLSVRRAGEAKRRAVAL